MEYNKKYKSYDKPIGEKLIEPDVKEVEQPVEQKKQVKMVVANCHKLNVRREPNIDSTIMCVINQGESLQVDDIKDGWAKVYTIAGIEGYVMENYVKGV